MIALDILVIKIYFLLFCFLVSIRSEATFFKMEDFKLAVGIQAYNQNYKNGITSYGGYQVLPFFAVQLFHPDLLWTGTSLYYRHDLTDYFKLRGRMALNSTGDQPLYYTTEAKQERIRRDSTAELDLFIELSLPNKAESFLRLQFGQDIVAHGGQFTEVYARFSLVDLYKKPGEKALLNLGFFSALGFSSSGYAEYLYGAGAKGRFALSHGELGLSVVSPKVIDVFWPTFKVSRYFIIGEQNRSASYVQEKSEWRMELLMAFKVW